MFSACADWRVVCSIMPPFVDLTKRRRNEACGKEIILFPLLLNLEHNCVTRPGVLLLFLLSFLVLVLFLSTQLNVVSLSIMHRVVPKLRSRSPPQEDTHRILSVCYTFYRWGPNINSWKFPGRTVSDASIRRGRRRPWTELHARQTHQGIDGSCGWGKCFVLR